MFRRYKLIFRLYTHEWVTFHSLGKLARRLQRMQNTGIYIYILQFDTVPAFLTASILFTYTFYALTSYFC